MEPIGWLSLGILIGFFYYWALDSIANQQGKR